MPRQGALKRTYRVLRTIIVSLLSVAVGIPLFLYILLSFGSVHDKIRQTAAGELSALFGAEVSIGKFKAVPFNRIELSDVSVALDGDTLVAASALNAGISFSNLLRGRIVVTDVELMHPDIRISKETPDAPLNVQPILDRLKGEDKKEPQSFNLAVHTFVIRSGRASYDVLSEPLRSGLDPNHVSIGGLRADLTAPQISNERITVSLKRLNFTEKSGLAVRNVRANIAFSDGMLNLSGLNLTMPQSSLSFADMTMNLSGAGKLADIEILKGSTINMADLSPIVPALGNLNGKIALSGAAVLFRDSLNVKSFNLGMPSQQIVLRTSAEASANAVRLHSLELGLNGPILSQVLNSLKPLPASQSTMIDALGDVGLSCVASWRKPGDAGIAGELTSALGNVSFDANLTAKGLAGEVKAEAVNLGVIVPGQSLGLADIAAWFDVGSQSGNARVSVPRLQWRNHLYEGVDASMSYQGKAYSGSISIVDTLATAEARVSINLTPGAVGASLSASVDNLQPYELGLIDKYEGHSLQADIEGSFEGEAFHRCVGQMEIANMRFTDSDGNGLIEAPILLTTDLSGPDGEISLTSDLIDFSARGEINLSTIGNTLNNILSQVLPEHIEPKAVNADEPNNFIFEATIHDVAPLFDFINTPAKLLYPVTITGSVDQTTEKASVLVSAPYLQQGNNLISKTSVSAQLGSDASLNVHTKMPSKFGNMELDLSTTMATSGGRARFLLNDPTTDTYSAELNLNFQPTASGADIQIEQSSLNFGDSDMNWDIAPSDINIDNGRITFSGLSLKRPNQELYISGTASASHEDTLTVNLHKINLDNIFTALRMNQVVQFGGIADGTVTGCGLLGKEPILQTEDLFAKDLKYSHCLMGDARIKARWNNESRGIEILADVDGNVPDGYVGVDGVIYPMTQELDFKFKARHAPVSFLHTFMSTWASKVGGYASGDVHLYGDFKLVDLVGDVYAEDFALTVGFTNVTYYATDSVRIRPGRIILDRVAVRDESGRTAKVSGELTHSWFQDARFNFHIGELDNILAYDVGPSLDSFWYGKIRANGAVDIKGEPGHVLIEADVSTAPNSEFTFELTDKASAHEYDFLTFNDVTPVTRNDTVVLLPGSPELDKLMQERVKQKTVSHLLSNYEFNMQVGITPDIKMTLVMDPISGDKITAYGDGHIGILYGSRTNEMQLYGEYIISRGNYNFSLQDIILKNFTLSSGSSVAFNGDPNAAILDLSAIYQLNANLTDLDESFKTDKEVQRTNVPVNAVLNVDGNINEPQISFDIDFPTLTTDVKRKVSSIVNTEEMMNRQIIYLLALNRFYTPEYMAATKGNELVSVASGTISSQLSNILGQLSDKISVAPSLRSNADDFSDVEFDVALSSTLLNNRLLLNGNFGYRDKAMNSSSTQFVGDLDVEYLLTRQGNWRLKAYNHFNDRNLYVKTALTTQGLGLVFKHDFDSLIPRRKKKVEAEADSVSGN